MSTTADAKGKKGHKSGKRRSWKNQHVREIRGHMNKAAKHDNRMCNHVFRRQDDQTTYLLRMIHKFRGGTLRASKGFLAALNAVMFDINRQVAQQISHHAADTRTIRLRHVKAALGNVLLDPDVHKEALEAAVATYNTVESERKKGSSRKTKRASTKD